ncbi:hypothetical protein SO802_007143 [Lithocarpus litseifolius]|uniref:Ubiquitin-like protease family profile domain-containing protein n=1 Tax=Lithocarpus litseifolius TaxID=425828 RepID=A0AAW2DRT9_9ROSI
MFTLLQRVNLQFRAGINSSEEQLLQCQTHSISSSPLTNGAAAHVVCGAKAATPDLRDIIGFSCFKYHFLRRHWSLLIFCRFGESTKLETRTPCMLLLDSLEKANPRQLKPDIRKFVLDIYKEEGRLESKDPIYQIPLLVPKVPQQRNGEECGSFVLYFINLFMESAPEDFSTQYFPYFMKDNWFAPEGWKNFRENIDSLKEKSDVDELL